MNPKQNCKRQIKTCYFSNVLLNHINHSSHDPINFFLNFPLNYQNSVRPYQKNTWKDNIDSFHKSHFSGPVLQLSHEVTPWQKGRATCKQAQSWSFKICCGNWVCFFYPPCCVPHITLKRMFNCVFCLRFLYLGVLVFWVLYGFLWGLVVAGVFCFLFVFEVR